jgi:hypothetical protein
MAAWPHVRAGFFSRVQWAARSGAFKDCVRGVVAGYAADRAASTGAAAADQ